MENIRILCGAIEAPANMNIGVSREATAAARGLNSNCSENINL